MAPSTCRGWWSFTGDAVDHHALGLGLDVREVRQVGTSGKAVTPDLYVSAGISGAPEFIEGMEDSESVVASNTDRETPIFDYTDYGTAVDLFEGRSGLAEQAGD